MLWLSGCFFVLAALTRQMAPVYVAGVVLLVGYMIAINLLGDMDNKTLAAMIDPSGATAFDVLARYWSVAQKNAQEIPFAGELAVESRVVAGRRASSSRSRAIAAFRMQAVAPSRARKRKTVDEPARRVGAGRVALPAAVLDRARGRVRPHAARTRAPVSDRDPAQPALPDDRARRRAAGDRQRDDAGLVLRHEHVSADLQGARRRRRVSSACSC